MMKAADVKKAEQALEQTRKAIGQWRQTREKLGEMPAHLWENATAVARTVGVYRVSKTLGLNYRALQDRVTPRVSDEVGPGRRAGRPPKRLASPFVEVPSAPLFSSTQAESTIEVVATDGARLTLRVKGGSGIDFAGLITAFREGRR